MILFFRTPSATTYAVEAAHSLAQEDIQKLTWLFSGAIFDNSLSLAGNFIGPRKEMVSPWSTNAVEIAQNMGIDGIARIEEFIEAGNGQAAHDPMLQRTYNGLDQEIFNIRHQPEPVIEIADLGAYSANEGLALSQEEIAYLNGVSEQLGRKLTDSEVFGFSQVNSEHCRHKIFNGTFIIDGREMPETLFQLIKKTSKENPNYIVSAYSDNVAFIKGPKIEQFAPGRQDVPDYFQVSDIESVISLKAETHNFPTTVEPFNGAATGSGGEIRDRLAGGKGSLPLAGTAVYITSYPRLGNGRPWEKKIKARQWLYQSPAQILIKASDGASDFGNKFGQPLIGGSVLTFEHFEGDKKYGFDKVVMLAGGVGYAKEKDSKKEKPRAGDKIIMMGGDNYRIGMGGGAVSSVATGEFGNAIELNAIQRSNPEMQKRVMNAIRAMVEMKDNPIISIHDHGAGGHLNCFSELLEETGGTIEIDKLPVGDPTLSDKEIISNESQERMGIAMRMDDVEILKKVSERERAPMYLVGAASGNMELRFVNNKKKTLPFDLMVGHLFGSSPKTVLSDETQPAQYPKLEYEAQRFEEYLHAVLQLESVACKDWLTNKVDRCVTGKVATQQTCGAIQLPLNNVSVMALDFLGNKGVATGIGHAPSASLVNAAAGSQLASAEALTNIVWAPLSYGLKGVSLSANWMWPAKNKGEDARLYQAVASVSNFSLALGINVPTGKDSLSMAQKYPNGEVVYSPGTVIISAVAEVEDIRKTVSPALQNIEGSKILYIDFSKTALVLGGSSFAQVINQLGNQVPGVSDPKYFAQSFEAIQQLIKQKLILAGHDISAGGMITALLEMCFPTPNVGLDINIKALGNDPINILFSENPGVLIQVSNDGKAEEELTKHGVAYAILGTPTTQRFLSLQTQIDSHQLDIDALRDTWFKTSFLMDQLQRPKAHAEQRKNNYAKQELVYKIQPRFDGKFSSYNIDPKRRKPSGIKAAIIREKGVNGDREMAYALYLAGFDVKDVHMTDLVSGREDLSDVNMIAFVGGFSNSDVLGSAKGWAGAFLYNPKAKASLDNFYARKDTLSLGVCNGCQLMMELGLLYPGWEGHPKMHHNGSGKFESTFLNVTIPKTNSVMLQSLEGARLGIWVAHGEGRFQLPSDASRFQMAAVYSHQAYPGNPNDSDFSAAALTSHDGRHLAIMPHLERSLFPWNWPYYPSNRKGDQVSPWIEAFTNALDWVKEKKK
ncbi:MAG: phosphoribosylformylglycinamidine synthase [Cyclobacteriaceae bacterium]|nr:phosphoribosylformylglycinamidine synthase [Cyclobacteriaceae bacterium]MCB0498050.1 phosphoribosylformylglycinamidine synthase [Cyclobacteriaceae bacterium]MCB9238774.1 phosphoribosylformylglycinamidine synthase [Flammeovirgaceae bacterium]MCO5270493.1 phosphoribosylformylglycinamidine synthase [Cyclobacteriaceae bacterium]MCW5901066.1 phosphoribosylformylglycinamidine synthase [Cyclobacteriaceae bacterium]